MSLAGSPRLRVLGLVLMVTLAGGCKGNVDEGQIISDTKKYLALADSGDPEAYQRLSSSAKKYITEAAFVERMKPEPGVQLEKRNIEVVGVWEKTALVQYEVKSGTGSWEREAGFYTKEPGGWMRAFSRQLAGELEDAMKIGPTAEEPILMKLVEVAPDPVSYIALCSLYYKRGDKSAGERACQMVVQSASHFPTKRYRELQVLAHELLASRADRDWATGVREASAALALLDKHTDLSRDREGSLRFIRLGSYMHQFQERTGVLSPSEWELAEEDWKKLRMLCETGPCSGLRGSVQSVSAGTEAFLAMRRSARSAEAAPQTRGLGGGYKGIKWGSSPKQVILALGMKPKESSADALTFKYGKVDDGAEKELTCLFYKGELFGVLFEPGLSDGDQQGANAISQALVEKYGKAEEVTGLVDGVMGLPLIASEWNDGETMIRSTIMDPEKLEEGLRSVGGGRNRLGYPSSTLKVAYSSIAIAARKNREEHESKAHAEKEEQQRKKAKFSGDL